MNAHKVMLISLMFTVTNHLLNSQIRQKTIDCGHIWITPTLWQRLNQLTGVSKCFCVSVCVCVVSVVNLLYFHSELQYDYERPWPLTDLRLWLMHAIMKPRLNISHILQYWRDQYSNQIITLFLHTILTKAPAAQPRNLSGCLKPELKAKVLHPLHCAALFVHKSWRCM